MEVNMLKVETQYMLKNVAEWMKPEKVRKKKRNYAKISSLKKANVNQMTKKN